jgi:hypothetical protein
MTYKPEINFLILLFLLIMVLSVTNSCAAQHKYRKIKSVPCPCEKLNKK